jgi:hypothetical protein
MATQPCCSCFLPTCNCQSRLQRYVRPWASHGAFKALAQPSTNDQFVVVQCPVRACLRLGSGAGQLSQLYAAQG